MLVTILTLVSLGLIDEIRDYVLSIGVGGYAIFFALIVIVTQPFGWGYTPIVVAIGFVYGWKGLIISQISTAVGCLISFLECRYLAKESLQKRLDTLQPKLQLIVKKLESVATKNVQSSYPFMIFSRNSPLNIGMVNGIFALSEVTISRFIITTFLGTMLEQPISINIGILIFQVSEIEDSVVVGNSTGTNSTSSETDDLKEEQEFLENLVFGFSVTVTLLFFMFSILYTRWMMKKLSKASEDDIWKEIKLLDGDLNADSGNDDVNSKAVVQSEQSLSFQFVD
mmetsp:Transcript_2081/g.2396  ORF Transcript_2081/g.2396 Transcript_2081/m.2396 type:complete len:283 (-) Transcript_2081:887-1735(-)